MISIEFSESDFAEIVTNYRYRCDESYSIQTAYMLWNAMKEQYPEEFEGGEDDE